MRNTFFEEISILTKNSRNNYFENDKTCLRLSNKLYFARYDTLFGYTQHFNFRKRCSFSVPSWLEKENQPSLLGKKEHLFAKFKCSKTILFVSIITVICCFYHFLKKNVSWGALLKCRYNICRKDVPLLLN